MKTFISSDKSRDFHCHCLELRFNVILVLIVARIFTPYQLCGVHLLRSVAEVFV